MPASVVAVVVGLALVIGAATATTAAPAALAVVAPARQPVSYRSMTATSTTATTVATTEPSTTTTVVAAPVEPPPEPPPESPAAPPPERPPEPPPEPSPERDDAVPSPVDRVVAYALAQRGHPYRRGAAGPGAFDCSGLTRAAYATVGVDLPHYSVTQADRGRAIDWRTEPIRAGDLVFVRGDTPVIDLGHVGLAVSATEWVVASRPGVPVRVTRIPTAIQRVRRVFEN